MGAFAEAVQERLSATLAERLPAFEWATEHYVDGTPIDVAGIDSERLVAVELEWRRADPADNTAKLFRHLAAGALDDYEEIAVFQVFTAYYDLSSGGVSTSDASGGSGRERSECPGVSSKRKNAEFVGHTAARRFDHLSYRPVDFDLDPPKRGAEWPDGWESVADETATAIASDVE